MIRGILLTMGVTATLLGAAAVAYAQTYSSGVTTDVPLTPGASVTLTACCYRPGTVVRFRLVTGSPLGLGSPGGETAIAQSDGTATVTGTVPVDATPGTITLSVSGTPIPGTGTPGTQQVVLPVLPPAGTTTTAVTPPTSSAVAAAEEEAGPGSGTTGTLPGTLPVTGSALSRRLALVGAVLLAAGVATLTLRRHRTATTS